jgi:hypothetical protein
MKRIYTFGLLVAAAFALTNCAQKESYAPVQEEAKKYVTCELVVKLPAETKTYNEGLHTKWSADDQIGLIVKYYKNQSTGWLPDYQMVTEPCDDPFVHVGNGKFVGKLDEKIISGYLTGLLGSSFTAIYPYGSNGEVPASTVQTGYDSMAHLAGANCPLKKEISMSWSQDFRDMVDSWSESQNIPYALPAVELKHVTSVIEVAVTNSTAAAIEVNKVDFLVGGEVKATTVVENAGALAPDQAAKIYIVVEPGTYSALSFTVNDTFFKTINAAEATFTAGKIKKVNFELK